MFSDRDPLPALVRPTTPHADAILGTGADDSWPPAEVIESFERFSLHDHAEQVEAFAETIPPKATSSAGASVADLLRAVNRDLLASSARLSEQSDGCAARAASARDAQVAMHDLVMRTEAAIVDDPRPDSVESLIAAARAMCRSIAEQTVATW